MAKKFDEAADAQVKKMEAAAKAHELAQYQGFTYGDRRHWELKKISLKAGATELVSVVGESFRQPAISEAIGREGVEEVAVDVWCLLWADFDNEHDRNAVAVAIGDHHVGFLSREDAAVYRPAVNQAEAKGALLTCEGRVAGAAPGQHETTDAGVTLELPTPEKTAEMVRDWLEN